ncbi:MAG TPA: hypothetical protein VES93_15750 [Ornithinibacter sp.]|nr:hypothetical protein [Ornithinibacter sp.]
MSTPPQEPLVPPSLPPAPGAEGYSQAGPPSAQPGYQAPGHPAAHGYAAADWAHQPAWGQPAWGLPESRALTEAEAALRKARTALGWAVGASVGALLAMLLAVGSLLAVGGSSDDDYGYEPLRSEVSGLADRAALGGDLLEDAVVDLLRSVGSVDVGVTCPDTEAVTVSTAVVCTGDVDGSAWTGIVFFEDTQGTFVVLEV